jgi:hypothetical protein
VLRGACPSTDYWPIRFLLQLRQISVVLVEGQLGFFRQPSPQLHFGNPPSAPTQGSLAFRRVTQLVKLIQ